MRTYILTEKERKLLELYIRKGITSDAFYVLMNRIQSYYEKLATELELIHKVLQKRGLHTK